LSIVKLMTAVWRARNVSSESDQYSPRTRNISVRTLYPTELSAQLRAVRRVVFILSGPNTVRSPLLEALLRPHVKLLVTGQLNLAMFETMTERCEHVLNDQTLERLISEILECEDDDARLCISQMALSEMNCTEVYDTLFRWMGETRVLVETVTPTHDGDLERLKNLSRCFPDARYIWETSNPRGLDSVEQNQWYASNKVISTFLSEMPGPTWTHVKDIDLITDTKNIAEQVTSVIGVFVSRHYDRMAASLTESLPLSARARDDSQLESDIDSFALELGYHSPMFDT